MALEWPAGKTGQSPGGFDHGCMARFLNDALYAASAGSHFAPDSSHTGAGCAPAFIHGDMSPAFYWPGTYLGRAAWLSRFFWQGSATWLPRLFALLIYLHDDGCWWMPLFCLARIVDGLINGVTILTGRHSKRNHMLAETLLQYLRTCSAHIREDQISCS